MHFFSNLSLTGTICGGTFTKAYNIKELNFTCRMQTIVFAQVPSFGNFYRSCELREVKDLPTAGY